MHDHFVKVLIRLWTSLYADDCILLFQSRDELIRGPSHILAHLRKFGLCMHFGRGDAASKTEAIYFPLPRTAYEAADTSRFYIDGTGFIDFCEKFKYLLRFNPPLHAYL